MPIPAFDHNGVVPPHLGNPTQPTLVSPYWCTTAELVESLGRTVERQNILRGFLNFRERLRQEGLTNGFQWLDGSFVEDVERTQGRPPHDLDVVTFYSGYSLDQQDIIFARLPEACDSRLAKANFHLDHYIVDASGDPLWTVDLTRYWTQLFSHNRQGVWKGMLAVEIDTPELDATARTLLEGASRR